MIPQLKDKTGNTLIGNLIFAIECLVEEERNGIFELTMIYPINHDIYHSLVEGNIIVADANDTLKAQMFRIYMTRKLMSNRIEIYARHISFDLAYDFIEGLSINNQSCQYALSQIFSKSQFSTGYKAVSDIVNTNSISLSRVNCLEAIAGVRGSIIDTFGTSAEILRDNKTINVLNARGKNNGVSIEYKKNLTGFELEEDTSELVTRIYPYATYKDTEDNEITVTISSKFVDSPLINNYSHQFIKQYDYSDKFEDGEVPTESKLIEYAKKEYTVNKVDLPKQNFKIEFIPLSKCAGYSDLEDKINLCDTVTIIDTRYNINTLAKVVKYVYNVLKDRYDSMELGQPRTTLGDIIGGAGDSSQGTPGPPGPPGPPGADGSMGDFPNSLPSIPVLSYKVYGFGSVEISWTYESQVYYEYELYASKTYNFTPNTFDLIFKGQASTFLHQVNPGETWYYKCCCINTFGKRTAFSSQLTVTTSKVADLSNYVSNMAIGDALIGTLSLERGWVGQLKGNWIDAKQLSVTDSNNKRTLWIDSYGNVNLDVTSLKILSSSVATKDYVVENTDEIKLQLQSNINDVNQAVTNLDNYIDGTFKDGILTQSEKDSIKTYLKTLEIEKADVDKQYSTLYVNADLTETAASNLKTAYDNFVSKYNTLVSTINNILSYSSITSTQRTSLDTAFANHNSYLATYSQRVNEAINAISEKKKNDAKGYTDTQFNILDGKISSKISTNEVQSLIQQTEKNITTTVTNTKKDLQSQITQNATDISSKVSEGKFSTLLTQNSESIRIAWNKCSNYIQFANGALSIYNGVVSNSEKRAVFNENGNQFWRDGNYLGNIGTTILSGTTTRGISFSLEANAGYTTWAIKKTSDSTVHTMVWTYANKNINNYEKGKLHAGCDIDMHNYTLRNVKFEGGGLTGTMYFVHVKEVNSNGTLQRWANNCRLGFQNGILIDASWISS